MGAISISSRMFFLCCKWAMRWVQQMALSKVFNIKSNGRIEFDMPVALYNAINIRF